LICIPAFTDIVIDGEMRTAIKLIVEAKWIWWLTMLECIAFLYKKI
jgi:hypothetical protein